ncbi:MAG: hypothetical protein P1U42_00990 [Phycisphaerales bacterium]|nr:hypothetical protein [Phycisphaerales bacterium]
MSQFGDGNTPNSIDGANQSEASSNIFLNMAEADSTGIPSLKQAPTSAISSSTPDSKVNTQLVIAACVVAIGGGAIYGMRYIGMKAGLDENIVSINYASETSNVEFSKRFNSVMKDLDESTLSVQLSDKHSFAENPFSRPSSMPVEVEPVDPGMSEAERAEIRRQRELEIEREERREMVISDARRYKLQGIIGGSNPAARISGQAVRVGMVLGDVFTVEVITGRSVIIEADGMRFELAIGEDTVQLN